MQEDYTLRSILNLTFRCLPPFSLFKGEGISSLQELYDHHVTPKEQTLADEDDSRTSLCALFFIKKGFPFVSILDGGYAAAHAWLARDGVKKGLHMSSILVDYEEETSLFVQLEAAYREKQEFANATTREKTTRALQKVMDNSIVGLTVTEHKIENFYADLANSEAREKVKQSMSKLFTSSDVGVSGVGRQAKMSQRTSELYDQISSFRANIPTDNSYHFVAKEPYGPPLGDDKPSAEDRTAGASAGDGFKNVMAKFKATLEEKRDGEGEKRNGEKESFKNTMARFRSRLEERSGVDNAENSDVKDKSGESAVQKSVLKKINFSGFSHTFVGKKKVGNSSTTLPTAPKDQGPKDEVMDDKIKDDEKLSEHGNMFPKIRFGGFAPIIQRYEKQTGGSNDQGDDGKKGPAGTRPQLGAVLRKKTFASKTDSNEQNCAVPGVLTSERFGNMLKQNPFASKITGQDEEDVNGKENTRAEITKRPQFGAFVVEARNQISKLGGSSEDEELQKYMEAALEEDSGVSESKVNKIFGSVSFSQPKIFQKGDSGSRSVSKTDDGRKGNDSDTNKSIKKIMSDLAPNRKVSTEEESILFDDSDEGVTGEEVNKDDKAIAPSTTAGADGLEFGKEKAPQDEGSVGDLVLNGGTPFTNIQETNEGESQPISSPLK